MASNAKQKPAAKSAPAAADSSKRGSLKTNWRAHAHTELNVVTVTTPHKKSISPLSDSKNDSDGAIRLKCGGRGGGITNGSDSDLPDVVEVTAVSVQSARKKTQVRCMLALLKNYN